MLVRDVRDKLKAGMWVKANGDGDQKYYGGWFEGKVIDVCEEKFHLDVPKKGWKHWYIDFGNPTAEIEILKDVFKVGDRVKVVKKSTGECSGKENEYECCKDFIGEIGTVRHVTEKAITVNDFSNTDAWCEKFSPDCLERVGTYLFTEKQPPIAGKKGDTMKNIVRKVYAKDSLETAELVDSEFGDIDLGQGFMSTLALTEKKDVVLKEAKRRKKEREDREK